MTIENELPAELRQRLEAADSASSGAGSDDAELARLAALPPIEYDRHRQGAADRLGCRVGTLDEKVRALRRQLAETPATGKGSPLTLDRPEPWPETIDGAALLSDIAVAVQRYLVLPAEAADAVALWALHSHGHDAADHSPLLAITSPEKRCGKTTLLQLVAALVPAPLAASNISPAAIYRTIEACRPTLLIDEADTFLQGDDDVLRGVLNSGHSRTTAYVIRTVGEDHEPAKFRTWAPKAIACIGKLPGTLADRSVEVRMQRAMPGDRRERYRPRQVAPLMDRLCRQAARWVADHMSALTDADPALPEALHDRAQDNWRPLVAIADAAGGEWPERARRAAMGLSGAAAPEDQSHGTMLLSDIRDIFQARGCDRLASSDLADALGELEHRPWAEWKSGLITPAAVARMLKPFGIEPRGMRIGTATPKGYDRDWFADAWTRYLPDDSRPRAQHHASQPATPSESATPQRRCEISYLGRFESATPEHPVALRESGEVSNINGVADVALSAGGEVVETVAAQPLPMPATNPLPASSHTPRIAAGL